jgi:hypothetical protein
MQLVGYLYEDLRLCHVSVPKTSLCNMMMASANRHSSHTITAQEKYVKLGHVWTPVTIWNK